MNRDGEQALKTEELQGIRREKLPLERPELINTDGGHNRIARQSCYNLPDSNFVGFSIF